MKTTLKKTIAMLLAMLLIAMSLTACGGSSSSKKEPSTEDNSKEETEVTSTEESSVEETKETEETTTEEVTTEEPTTEETSTENYGNELDLSYVDHWFVNGILSSESLNIYVNYRWDAQNAIDSDGSGGHVICEGYFEVGEDNSLTLYEENDEMVGTVTLDNEELTFLRSLNYEWLFEQYVDVVLKREYDSVEGGETIDKYGEEAFQGIWQYPNGDVLEISYDVWTLFPVEGESHSGVAEYDEEDDVVNLRNESGSSGGGRLSFNEYGELTEYGNVLTKLENYNPYLPEHMTIISPFRFTGLETLEVNNDYNGGYLYRERTEDGLTVITNCCYLIENNEGGNMDLYLPKVPAAIGGPEPTDIVWREYNDEYESSYPVYMLSWVIDGEEESRLYDAFVLLTDTHTYVYSFDTPMSNYDLVREDWEFVFGQLVIE